LRFFFALASLTRQHVRVVEARGEDHEHVQEDADDVQRGDHEGAVHDGVGEGRVRDEAEREEHRQQPSLVQEHEDRAGRGQLVRVGGGGPEQVEGGRDGEQREEQEQVGGEGSVAKHEGDGKEEGGRVLGQGRQQRRARCEHVQQAGDAERGLEEREGGAGGQEGENAEVEGEEREGEQERRQRRVEEEGDGGHRHGEEGGDGEQVRRGVVPGRAKRAKRAK
jgi:hypothetical protein